MADGAGGVADYLHLDVAGAGDETLDVDGVVAEGGAGLRAGALVGGGEFGGVGDDAHATAAAAGDRFDDDGTAIAEAGEEGLGLLERDRAVAAGEERDALGFGERACSGLVAEQFEGVDGGADEGDAGGLASSGEVGVFGEEAVAGVDGVAAEVGGGGDDLVDVEVGGCAGASEGVGLVGFSEVGGLGVVFGADGDGGDVEFAGGAENADGNFATVGDEQFGQRHVGLPACAMCDWQRIRDALPDPSPVADEGG